MAASAPHVRGFLSALYLSPCSSVGTRMDDCSLRIAVALRIGLPVFTEYKCICGVVANAYGPGSHALSCNKTNGRHACHSSVNDP